MAAINDADISIDTSGNIRWTGAATTNRHSVLEFIQWLMSKQDDEQAAGDDILDITVDTPFERSTDQILTLNSPFNIDDTFALHLYDGSVAQNDGDDLYSGLSIIGPVESGTKYMIMQGGKLLPSFWGTGINAEASPSLVFSRHLIKSREGGSDIDGKRITVLARELGDQYRRFPVTLGTGNSVAAIGNGADIFNTTVDATLAAISDITNTEGFQEIDIDGTGASGQEFYSQWDKGANDVNDVYEFTKWITQRSSVTPSDSNVESGDNFVIDNGTITGCGQEFTAPATSEMLTGAKMSIKIGSGTPTGVAYAELFLSDEGADPAPTGSVLARSEDILVSHFTSSYEDILFQFNWRDPSDGSDQRTGLTLTASDKYFIVIQNPDGDSSNYLHAEGDLSSAVEGFADYSGSWAGNSGEALQFEVHTSPIIHGIAGDRFEGINVEVGYDGEAGSGLVEDDVAFWGTKVYYDNLSGGPFFPGEYVKIEDTGVIVSGGMVLYDDGTDELVIALDNPGAAVIGDGDDITGLTSGATCKIDTGGGAIEDEDLTGGEGIVLAIDDNTGTGELYLQIISGSNPVDNNRIRSQTTPLSNYVDATSSITTRTIIPEFLGTSTGSNIIGAYGIGFDKNDVGSSDLLRSLDNSSRTPPNNVLFKVIGLVAGEDRVLVGPRDSSDLDRGQWLLATALSGSAETEIVVKTGTDTVPFPNTKGSTWEINWPDSGLSSEVSKLRVQLDNGIYKHIDYDSHDGVDTFDITNSEASMKKFDVNGASVNNNVFMAFIDKLAESTEESFTGVHDTVNRDLFVRVRDGGGTPIKTYESVTAQFLSTPQTIAATRTNDY